MPSLLSKDYYVEMHNPEYQNSVAKQLYPSMLVNILINYELQYLNSTKQTNIQLYKKSYTHQQFIEEHRFVHEESRQWCREVEIGIIKIRKLQNMITVSHKNPKKTKQLNQPFGLPFVYHRERMKTDRVVSRKKLEIKRNFALAWNFFALDLPCLTAGSVCTELQNESISTL